MKQRKYFEILAYAGRKCVPGSDFPIAPETLLSDMKYARVHGAAVIDNTAEEYSFVYGNRECIKLAQANPRLESIAVVPTTAILETGDKNYFDSLIENGARAFAVTQGVRCPLNARSIEPVAEALIKNNKPLIIPAANGDEKLKQIDLIAGAFPELNIIMHGCSWGFGRAVCDVLLRNSNVYFDMSSFHLNNLLEMTKEHFGIERLLYSSAWPIKSMGAMKAFVEYADVSEEDKNLVAFGNACRLLGVDENKFELYDDAECELDSIAKEADAGMPISVPVIDSHTHMVPEEDKTVNNCIMLYSDCDSIAKKMDKLGIDSIITAPWSGISFDGIKGNEESLYAAKKHPGKFFGYSTCNVHYEEDLKAWKEYHEKYPDVFVGIKPYPPYQKFDYSDEVCQEWLSYANEHHLPVLVHSEAPSFLDSALPAIEKYPNATFIVAHTGSSYENARYCIEAAKKYPNVMLEITYTSTARGMIEFLVDQVGADRVLYGSDLPMRDPSPQLAWVCYAKISVEDKKKILADNIKNIMAKRK